MEGGGETNKLYNPHDLSSQLREYGIQMRPIIDLSITALMEEREEYSGGGVPEGALRGGDVLRLCRWKMTS